MKIILAIAAFIAALFGLSKAIEAQERFNCPDQRGISPQVTVTVTVQANDTMWKIAKRNCTGNIQVAVHHLVKKYGTLIHPGQQIQLP